MPNINLLLIDPDKLFQERSISEIDDVQKKLHNEIERKKEDLRVMVGERYRDLIQAADTIGEMKDTTANIKKHMENITAACKKINDSHLIGFKIESPLRSQDRPAIERSVHGIAVEIKLLMVIPEQIWSAIEAEDFLTVTQLFLFARHVHTGLQLETGAKQGHNNVVALYPIVQRQWSTLSNFNQIVVNACRDRLRNVDLEPEVAASCLASLYLMDGSRNMVNIMNTFIQLYSTDCLTSILAFDTERYSSYLDSKKIITEKIVNAVKLIIRTIELLHSCFVASNEGLVVSKLNKLFKKDATPLIHLVQFDDPVAFKMLPKVVTDYKLSNSVRLDPVEKSDISKCVCNWLEWTKQYTNQRLTAILKYVSNAKTLNDIREKALRIVMSKNWSEICHSLTISGDSCNVWVSLFQPRITARLMEIIDSKWAAAAESLKNNLKDRLEWMVTADCQEKEADLNWFVWKDIISETVIESKSEIISAMNSLMKGMWLQDRGYTPTLEKLCRNLNDNLANLLKDLKIYLYGESNSENKDSPYERDLLLSMDIDRENQIFFDRAKVENYLRECSTNNINSIISFIQINYLKAEEPKSELFRRTVPVFTARLLQSFLSLVPNLKLCFLPDSFSPILEDFDDRQSSASKAWIQMVDLLNEQSFVCWSIWIDIAMDRIKELLSILPSDFSTASNIDYLLMQWDSITIEENDDSDNPVKSTIKIPAGPSMKLQQFLYAVSQILDEVVPHTLPRKVHLTFIDRVSSATLNHMMGIITEKKISINQKCALQLLMDIRHLTLLMVSRENQDVSKVSQDICNILRERIDPFDYDVFYPYLQVNVKRSVQRVQILFGSLIPNYDHFTSIIGSKAILSGGSADKDPNLLMMASQDGCGAWFPLLPITVPVTLKKKPDKEQLKMQASTSSPGKLRGLEAVESLTSSVLAASGSNLRSGAAAFFGSMTSDWFGG